MSDPDERIRADLRAATEQVGRIDAAELAERLERRASIEARGTVRGAPRAPRRRRVAIAALIALVASVGWLGVRQLVGDDGSEVVADRAEPVRPTGFEAWTPGWHDVDTGPVPVGEPPSIAWLDGRLYAASTLPRPDGDDRSQGADLWSFEPASREWSTLPGPPFEQVEIVATGGGLVAVGGPGTAGPDSIDPPPSWASWSPGDDRWTGHGPVPVAEVLRRSGSSGPTPPTGARSLVWTGDVVIDVTSGAVLDPSTGDAEPLEMPADIGPYVHLVQATPVWTGTQMVVVSWSTRPGLSWDGAGRLLGEIPGPPMADPTYAVDAAAVALHHGALLLARDEASGDARAAGYDTATQEWTALPAPGSVEPWCPYTTAVVGGSVIARGCGDDGSGSTRLGTPYRLDRRSWSALPPPPRRERGVERWVGTERALIVWTGDADTTNNAEAPFQWLAVWIPDLDDTEAIAGTPASTTSSTTTSTSRPPTDIDTAGDCRVEQLPDLTASLPADLRVAPARGIGGMADSGDLCARHWTDPE